MSDTPLSADWWQAADGRWYPPPAPTPPTYAPPSYAPPAYGDPGYPPPTMAPATNSSAILALVLGILGLTSCYALTGIPAIIFGRKAQREIDESAGAQGGRGMATAGLVLGVIATALTTVFVLALIAVLALGATVEDDSYDYEYDPPVTVSVPR